MWEGMNQRQFPRIKYRCIVTLKQKGKGPSTVSSITENVGLGGVCVLLQRGLDIFSPVNLELSLEDGKPPLKLQGTIVWVVRRRAIKKVVSFDTGIEFLELSAEDKARIEAALDKAGLGVHP